MFCVFPTSIRREIKFKVINGGFMLLRNKKIKCELYPKLMCKCVSIAHRIHAIATLMDCYIPKYRRVVVD